MASLAARPIEAGQVKAMEVYGKTTSPASSAPPPISPLAARAAETTLHRSPRAFINKRQEAIVIRTLDERIAPIVSRVSTAAPRFGPYRRLLGDALQRVQFDWAFYWEDMGHKTASLCSPAVRNPRLP